MSIDLYITQFLTTFAQRKIHNNLLQNKRLQAGFFKQFLNGN